MLSKSKASPCILTLIISFILSDYLSKVLKDKLKPCKINCWFLANLRKSSRTFFVRNYLLETRNKLYTKTLALITKKIQNLNII
jgi:hypothetical protein